ncbi:hypothetical protein ACSBR2_033660 [Camellia fascicularis]
MHSIAGQILAMKCSALEVCRCFRNSFYWAWFENSFSLRVVICRSHALINCTIDSHIFSPSLNKSLYKLIWVVFVLVLLFIFLSDALVILLFYMRPVSLHLPLSSSSWLLPPCSLPFPLPPPTLVATFLATLPHSRHPSLPGHSFPKLFIPQTHYCNPATSDHHCNPLLSFHNHRDPQMYSHYDLGRCKSGEGWEQVTVFGAGGTQAMLQLGF